MASFKDRFKELRLEKDLTLREMGNVLGLTDSTISLYESGKRQPKGADDFIRIADFFGVSIDYLVGRADDRNTIIVHHNVDGKDIEIGVDKSIYPDGLTHEQVLEILDNLKKMGMNFDYSNNK